MSVEHIKLEINSLDASTKRLRQFGLLVGSVLAAICLYWDFGPWLLAVGAILVVLAVLSPNLLKIPYRAWMGFAIIAGFLVSKMLLIIIFFIIITPIGLVKKAVSGSMVSDKEQGSCWHKVDPKDKDIKGLEFPF